MVFSRRKIQANEKLWLMLSANTVFKKLLLDLSCLNWNSININSDTNKSIFKVLITLSENDCSLFSIVAQRILKVNTSWCFLDYVTGKKKKKTNLCEHWYYLWKNANCHPDCNIECPWQCLYCSICTLFLLQTLPPSSPWEAACLWDFWQKHLASHTVPRI